MGEILISTFQFKKKSVGLSVYHDKGIGLSFLVLGVKSGNQEQGQVSGCLVSAAAALLPSCRHLQMPTSPGQAKGLSFCFLGEKGHGQKRWMMLT